MKLKILPPIAIVSLFVFTSVHSQKSFAILKGGVNFANVSTTPDGRIDNANMLTSLQVGIIGYVHIAPFFNFQP